LLFEAHVQRAGAEGLLTEQDWREARRKIVQAATTPRLRLNLNKCRAWIGSREFTLTPQECRLLRALANHPSGCEWEQLIELVWDTREGVDKGAVLETIGRLRKKLGDDANAPAYLHIERGQGCRLTNFEIG
jgi:DNA-binding response OmpR family regulator